MNNKIEKYVADYERFILGTASEVTKIINQHYTGDKYVAAPGASIWTRMKVRYKNWADKRKRKK